MASDDILRPLLRRSLILQNDIQQIKQKPWLTLSLLLLAYSIPYNARLSLKQQKYLTPNIHSINQKGQI